MLLDNTKHGKCIMQIGCLGCLSAQCHKSSLSGSANLPLLLTLQTVKTTPVKPRSQNGVQLTRSGGKLQTTQSTPMLPFGHNTMMHRLEINLMGGHFLRGKQGMKTNTGTIMQVGNGINPHGGLVTHG